MPQAQREAAGKAIAVVALLWLLSILVGGWLHHGTGLLIFYRHKMKASI